MLELLFILFTIIFIAVQLSDRRGFRVCFAILTLIALAAGGIMLRLAHSYGRSYIASAVNDLAKKAPPDQRERLVAATKEFGQKFQQESAFSIAASSQLGSELKQVNSKESPQAGASDRR
jgi:hypothetical protein